MVDDSRKLDMTLTKYMFHLVKKTFDLTNEFSAGTVFELPDGRMKIEIKISGHKRRMFEEYLRILIATPSDQVKIQYFGSSINPN